MPYLGFQYLGSTIMNTESAENAAQFFLQFFLSLLIPFLLAVKVRGPRLRLLALNTQKCTIPLNYWAITHYFELQTLHRLNTCQFPSLFLAQQYGHGHENALFLPRRHHFDEVCVPNCTKRSVFQAK